VIDPLVGLWLVAAGFLGRLRRPASRVGALMALAGATWLAGAAVPALAFAHRGPLVHLHLTYPSGRLRRRRVRAVTAAVYVASVIEGITGLPWLTFGLSVAVAAVASDTFARTTGAARKAARPALGAALAFAAVLAASALDRVFTLGLDSLLAVGYDLVVASAVGVLLLDLLTGRWVDATVTDLVLALGSRAGITGLRSQLRRALGDPTLELGLRLPGRTGYVDERGHPLVVDDEGGPRIVTRLQDDAGAVAVLVHGPAALDDPVLLTAVAAAARLAVANVLMQAEIENRAAELAATGRRIVEAADLERRALVETLHHGAEQRLGAADAILAGLSPPDAEPSDAALFTRIRGELAAAVDDLHDLARGIRPPALTAGGLALAVPALGDRAGLPVTTTVDVGRLPSTDEAILYFVCAEALANAAKHSRATCVHVDITQVDDAVTASVTDDGVGGADPTGAGLQGLLDRVSAVGGTLGISDTAPHGTRLTVRLPQLPEQVAAAGGSGP
jgi:signal transduction histidine kinase